MTTFNERAEQKERRTREAFEERIDKSKGS